jgi:putative endonuclease
MFKGLFGRGSSTKGVGDAAEARALDYLLRQGLHLVQRNYRVARGPRARGGEVDLVLRERDGTLVFVEVRARRDGVHGSAAETVTIAKQRRIVCQVPPPCRFDVVAIEGAEVQWLKAAFEAGL